MKLTLEPELGENIEGCCDRAAFIARLLGVDVHFTHNEITVQARPADTADSVYRMWARFRCERAVLEERRGA